MVDHEHKEEQRTPNNLGPSLLFIYFMMGFVIGSILTMITLSFLRPFLPPNAEWINSLVLSPLFIGGGLGYRVARLGAKGPLLLSEALMCALFLKRPPS